MRRLVNRIRGLLVGRRFEAALKRSREAADRLDAALREELRR